MFWKFKEKKLFRSNFVAVIILLYMHTAFSRIQCITYHRIKETELKNLSIFKKYFINICALPILSCRVLYTVNIYITCCDRKKDYLQYKIIKMYNLNFVI